MGNKQWLPVFGLALLAWGCDEGRSPVASPEYDAGRVVASIPLEFSEGIMTPDSGTLYVMNCYGHFVSVVDGRSHEVVETIDLGETETTGTGFLDCDLAITPDGRSLYVNQNQTDEIIAISTSGNQVSRVIPVGRGPGGISISPDGRFAYVANIDGSGANAEDISVISTSSNEVVGAVPIPDRLRPLGMFIPPGSRRGFAVGWDSSKIAVVDLSAREVTKTVGTGLAQSGYAAVRSSRDGSRLYVGYAGAGALIVVDTASLEVAADLAVRLGPYPSFAVHPDRDLVYAALPDSDYVSVWDVPAAAVRETIPAGRFPGTVGMTPGGETLYVANLIDETVSAIDLETHEVAATIPVGSSPAIALVSPDGRFVYVANSDRTISVIDRLPQEP